MKKVIFLIMCLFPATLVAQSAMDYFHKSANFYVNANKKSAQSSIKEGIEKFPDNQKLKDLASKIAELPDPEDDQNQPDKDKQNQEQQEPDQQQQQQQQQQISREDAQRMLDAIAQEEKELLEKLQQKERSGHRPKIEKNW